MDADNVGILGILAVSAVIVLGMGWLIARDQDHSQQRAIACIAAEKQFISGHCVASPAP